MSDDELAEINGIKPKVYLQDGAEQDVKSASSSSTYKVKRTWDHYYCACPAWRNQSGVPVNARSCKHLKALLGDEYEEARMKLKNPDGPPAAKGKAPASKKKPVSKPKATATKKRKKADDDEADEVRDEEEQGEDEEHRRKKTRKGPASRIKSNPNAMVVDAIDEPVKEDEGDEIANSSDELAEIDGIKPKVYLKDGAEKEVSSMPSSSTYKVKRTWDHYYCTCPAWRNQGGVPVNARSCKHLKSLLGDEYEEARMKLKNPDGVPAKGKSAQKAKAKRRKRGDDEDEDNDEEDEGKGKDAAPELLLANKWDLENGADPTGWWISEKLDGVRTFYDGKRMISRLGNPFTPPKWLLDKLPTEVTLDGELFFGRGEFQSTVSIVKTMNSPHWKGITFQIFDIPSRGTSPFEDRMLFLKELFGPGGSHACEEIVLVEHEKARNRQHVLDKLKEIETLGGEGLMLRRPGSEYEGRRSGSLLKIKTFYDAEARVTGYMPGKGRLAGLTGALKCEMESGKKFNVGTGLSDKQRKNPPKIGSIITYRFQELTRDGVPRFPSYIGQPIDKDGPKDAEIPEHRKQGAKPTSAGE